jgi:hypothetical protein
MPRHGPPGDLPRGLTSFMPKKRPRGLLRGVSFL